VKIGEGTYGEVFRGPTTPDGALARGGGGPGRDTRDDDDLPPSLVVKIIPMEGDVEVNGAPQKGAGDLMAEAVIALALSGLRAEEGQAGGWGWGRGG
jgi:hypothetical protein